MAKFRKRPIVIEAEQYTGPGEVSRYNTPPPAPAGVTWIRLGSDMAQFPVVKTLEGEMHVSPGDWIITGVQGERYPCKPDIFAATYEAVE